MEVALDKTEKLLLGIRDLLGEMRDLAISTPVCHSNMFLENKLGVVQLRPPMADEAHRPDANHKAAASKRTTLCNSSVESVEPALL